MDSDWVAQLENLAKRIASFEDAPTQQGRTTGEASGGRHFEKVVAEGLIGLVELLRGANAVLVHRVAEGYDTCETLLDDALAITSREKERVLVFRHPAFKHFSKRIGDLCTSDCIPVRREFLKGTFAVEEWYNQWLRELKAKRWIPTDDEEELPFRGDKYRELYAGMSTKFDGLILLLEGGVLREKILLEIKSLKSSKRSWIDGNAHERFAYQNLNYLEIAALK